jgi:two-component system, oxyanion-binding sensor
MSAEHRADVTIGFMPLLDCALLVVAHEVGMARQAGLSMRLVRESSWANIRDRVAIGHFDAAHMLGPMVVADSAGPARARAGFRTDIFNNALLGAATSRG